MVHPDNQLKQVLNPCLNTHNLPSVYTSVNDLEYRPLRIINESSGGNMDLLLAIHSTVYIWLCQHAFSKTQVKIMSSIMHFSQNGSTYCTVQSKHCYKTFSFLHIQKCVGGLSCIMALLSPHRFKFLMTVMEKLTGMTSKEAFTKRFFTVSKSRSV